MSSGKALRMRRFFRHKRTVIVPMDHPMFSGPAAGLENPVEVVRRIASTEADGILVSPWALPRLAPVAGQLGIVARMDGGNTSLGERIDQTDIVASMEYALRAGAEMIALNIFIGGENEPQMLQKLGRAGEACTTWGIPLMGEMIPTSALAHHYGKGQKQAYDASLGDPVAVVSRIGAEFGADLIKTVYSGQPDDLARAAQTATVPLIVAGGPKTGTDAEFLKMVKDCVMAGTAGICIGRNVWQRPRLEGMLAALCAIVHDDATVDEALRLL